MLGGIYVRTGWVPACCAFCRSADAVDIVDSDCRLCGLQSLFFYALSVSDVLRLPYSFPMFWMTGK